jgi:hypothetical protein
MAKPQWEFFNIYNNPEHDLFDMVNVEFTDISGFPIKYFVKTGISDSDPLYGENTTSTYTSGGYDTKIVYQPEEDVINMIDVFGFTPNDIIQYAMMPKSIFTRDVAALHGDSTLRPMVGDVIITLWNNKRYELTNVGSDQSVFLGKKMIWEFTLTPFKYSEESDSAEAILDYVPGEDDFPSMNDPGFDTEPLSGYGDNQWIEDESDDIDDNIDSSIYGY